MRHNELIVAGALGKSSEPTECLGRCTTYLILTLEKQGQHTEMRVDMRTTYLAQPCIHTCISITRETARCMTLSYGTAVKHYA